MPKCGGAGFPPQMGKGTVQHEGGSDLLPPFFVPASEASIVSTSGNAIFATSCEKALAPLQRLYKGGGLFSTYENHMLNAPPAGNGARIPSKSETLPHLWGRSLIRSPRYSILQRFCGKLQKTPAVPLHRQGGEMPSLWPAPCLILWWKTDICLLFLFTLAARPKS